MDLKSAWVVMSDSVGAGEGVGAMVKGQVLHRGLLQGREPVGAETCVDNELVEVRGFLKVTESGLVRRFGLMDPRK